MNELEKRVDEIETQIARIHGAIIVINATMGLLTLKLRAETIPH